MFRANQKILLGKEESIYGTDPVPTVADNAMEAKNIKVSYKGDVLERDIQRNDISPVIPVIGKRWVEISFDMEIKGSGTAGTAGKLGDLLEACGFAETASVGSSVTYLPSSSTMKSITLYVYELQDSGSSILHKLTGGRGNVSISLEAGAIGKMSFTFQGIYNAPADASAPNAPTYESTVPPIVQSAVFSLNSVTTLVVQSLSLDMGIDLQQSDDVSSAGSIKSFNIVGRKPTGNFNPEAVLLETYGFWTDWLAQTGRALSIVVGSVAGNIVTITAPKVTLDTVDVSERAGLATRDVPIRLSRSSGNDEIQIKFS